MIYDATRRAHQISDSKKEYIQFSSVTLVGTPQITHYEICKKH